MPVWNTATGEFLAYDDDFSFFDYQSGSPEAIPDMAYSQPASEPLSRFGSSNGSSNPSNPDPHFLSSINEPLYDQGQHEASMGQVGSSTSYWGYDDSADRFDALGSQFKPVSASSSFSSSPSFGNLHVHNPAYASGYDFSGVSQSHYDLPDVSQYFQSPNAASQALFSLSGPLDTFQETVVTQAASEDQVARTPRHHRSASSIEKLRRAKRDSPRVCHHQGCTSKPFNRPADLDRHYIQLHGSEKDKKSFYCDYSRCNRATTPFHRLDHCREHYREFHREDIDKRGVPLTLEWCQERNVKATWWRCNKCLARVTVHDDGFQCSVCQYECPEVRQVARGH